MAEYSEDTSIRTVEPEIDWRGEVRRLRSEVRRLQMKVQEQEDLLARVVEALECLQNAVLDQQQARASACIISRE
jgi:hypothetical protein